jgi:hypothetical protein
MSTRRISLRHLAHTRSGDKGDTANVGVIAFEPEFYPILVRELTTERVAASLDYSSGLVARTSRPSEVGPHGRFLIEGILGGLSKSKTGVRSRDRAGIDVRSRGLNSPS